MAAGLGKRMHSVLPKVLHPLAGRPLAAHVLASARELAPRRICVVVGHGGDAVAQALAAPDLVFVTQDPPRGTGDAARVALAALPADGVTIVMNGDCPLVPAAALRAVADVASSGGLALLTARVADPSGLGRIVRDTRDAVTGIVEDKDATPEQRAIDEIYSGVLAAPTAKLRKWVAAIRNDNAQGEFYLTDVLAMAVAEKTPVTAHLAREEDVLGVNDRAQLAAIERILQRRHAQALLLAGTWIADPERFDLRGTLGCGRDVRIDVGCVFEGDVRLGDEASVGPHCVLRDVTVGAGSTILAFTHIENSTIGANCRIGPYARLRPDTALSDDVHIGNFVEVKASTLGRGAKANHLAYVGDTTVGHAVNYGAGSIVANYDGAAKHRTVIGDNASIGSNCVLVAPVTIGEGATIGAGSVISDDAPPGALTIARSRQVSIAGWKRPVKKRPAGG
jgi:bifunctional UDP-N-acetylglucosamine pyrophosphorylase/glucosamine-1-phosphate N-acetyltransferase